MTDAALNPELGKTRAGQRKFTKDEKIQQAQAICSAKGDPRADFQGNKIHCTGDIFVGIFFDGTGNNEKIDYQDPPLPEREQKHSNIARLYHAYPRNIKIGTTGYYRYYIPGVGTPFAEIGDKGGTLGMASARGGESRIVWGLTRVFNAVSQYVYGGNIFSNENAAKLANSTDRKPLTEPWQDDLKKIIEGRKPEVTQINLSVFGFSRGAAQARAFVNWLYALCEQKNGRWLFAGINLRVQFLGLFDTVASVGVAGMFNIVEGHQSWATDNLQVHPEVQQCLHLVAAHEVRACFPLDSVRVDGKYPSNTREYLYPGAHSDVGGGYLPLCLGKKDWDAGDRQLARIPGYEMYCAALLAGVPLTRMNQLREPIAKALLPHVDTVKAFEAYYAAAQISAGPLEQMHRQHMGHYFTHRWHWLDQGLQSSLEWARAAKRPNKASKYANELQWLQDTQRSLITAIAAVLEEIDQRIATKFAFWSTDDRLEQPLVPRYLLTGKEQFVKRVRPWLDHEYQAKAAELAHKAPEYLVKWRQWLADNH